MNGSKHGAELLMLSTIKWEILQVAQQILVPQDGLYSKYVVSSK